MFGGWVSLAAAPSDLTEREREPPPKPTTLQFPRYAPSAQNKPLTKSSLQNLTSLLVAIRKPQDISEAHLEALNVDVECDVPLSDLVPEVPEVLEPFLHNTDFSKSEAPPTASSSGQTPPSSVSAPKLSNSYPAPDRKTYEGLKAELQIPNDDAFREVCRMPPRPGREKPRITQSRRFWLGLERMSQYWDTSLDEYYDVPDNGDDATSRAEEKGPQQPQETEADGGDGSSATTRKTKRVYRGRRISCGAEMPEDARDETIRRLLEMIVWPFRCQVTVPNVAPRLAVGNILFPVRHTFTAARSPPDYQMARKGILEGPLIAVQCRGETVFHNPNADKGKGAGQAEKLDLFREIGGMLLLAQERIREGREEKRSGEGKWWATVPRWGGGPGGEMEATDALIMSKEERSPVAEAETKAKDAVTAPVAQPLLDRPRNKRPRGGPGPGPGPGSGSGPARRMSMAERWKLVQPGPSTWDKKIRYMRIGKNRDAEEDDIYLLSSLNHHLSILHLHIHQDYLDWLADSSISATPNLNPTSSPSSSPPSSKANHHHHHNHRLHLQRTRWLDLLDVNDRLTAFDALWAITAWLMRDVNEDVDKDVEQQL